MAEHPFVTLMREKSAQVLTVAQGATVALEANPHQPQDVEMIRSAGAVIAAMIPEFLQDAGRFKGRTERATTAFADGLRLMGAGLLNIADGIEQQDGVPVAQGHSWYAMGSQQVRRAFEIMDADVPKMDTDKPKAGRPGKGEADKA